MSFGNIITIKRNVPPPMNPSDASATEYIVGLTPAEGKSVYEIN